MKKKRKKLQVFENVVMFPGTVEQLLSQAHGYAEQYQYDLANQKFAEALQYTYGDETALSVYAYSLYEARDFEKAKEICERLLEIGPSMYFEAMELYLTICMQLRQFQQVEKIIESLLEEEVIPDEQLDKFLRLKNLNADIVEKKREQEEQIIAQEIIDNELSTAQFLEKTTEEQLVMAQDLTTVNVRPIAPILKEVIEHEKTHPFIKSLLLILLVEQEVAIDVEVKKFNRARIVNPAELELPTGLPHFQAITTNILEQLHQEPSTLELVQHLITKHAIATYPFEWLDYDDEDVAIGYIDFVRQMFGKVQEMDYEIIDFLQQLEKLTELQHM
ncbi:tetratricopeptide repeat protein [Lysinibacillus sp. LZ02]|uniref:tetratricopeptide repeat protein n=1 Tax=Lysinibacillus sp. LZ02 TaxID=3420668 RepID=UPI003D35EF1E